MSESSTSPTLENPIHHPGFLLVSHWELEISFKGRENTEKIIFAINTFNLPERSSRTFDIIWGPGYPSMTYPGPVAPFEFSIDVTNFYTRNVVEHLISWHERTMVDFLPNLHDGFVIGYDDDKVIRYKADVFRMWPHRVSLGEMSRDTQRQRISASLACFDIIHDFNFDKFEFEPGIL